MNIHEYIENKQKIQNEFLNFIESEEESMTKYDEFKELLTDPQLISNKDEIKLLIHLISKVSNNHHRCPGFFAKINQVLQLLKNEITTNFSNIEIYKFFKENNRMLLLLIKGNILTVDETIIEKLKKRKHSNYFEPEITNGQLKECSLSIEEFNECRNKGENDNYICELIRADSIDEFIAYNNEKNIPIDLKIKQSIFETNQFLIGKNPRLIKYAAFFGSIRIFKYLQLNKAKMTPKLLLYAIHSNNPEIIEILLEKKKNPKDTKYNECLIESIKCHHNEFATYFKFTLMNNSNETIYVTESKYKYYNFAFFQEDLQDFFNDIFFLMEYEYHKLSNIVNEKYKFIINAEDYSIKGGEYDSSEVFNTVVNQKDNKLYFIKTGKNYIDFSALMKCRYPSIIRIKGFGLNNFEFVDNLLSTDYYDKTLDDYIIAEGKKSSGRETILTTRDYIIILGITIAMIHIHKFGFQYTILSPFFIFLDENYYPIISMLESQKMTQRIHPPPAYMAPECYKGKSMLESNVFSFSFILFKILTRKYPLDGFATHGISKLIRLISSNRRRLDLVKNGIFIELLQKCWDQNPEERLTFEEILEFITSMEFCSCFQPFDYESIKKYLDIYGDEFFEMKIKMHNIAFKLNDLK